MKESSSPDSLQPSDVKTVDLIIDGLVLARAQETFASREQAERWLHQHHLILGMSPAAFLRTGGAREQILRILDAISHGIPV